MPQLIPPSVRIDVALHVGAHGGPLGAIDHSDQTVELGRVLDFVLRLGEDLPQHPLVAT